MRILASLAVASLMATALAEVDLTPHYYTVSLGGSQLRRCYFADGDKKFAVTVDQETEIVSEGKGALFRFSTLPQASIQLKTSPVPAKSGFGQETLTAYNKAAQSLIDPTAREVSSEAGGLDVLPFNGWRSYRINFAYSIAGSRIRQSYTFMNMSAEQQVLIVVTAREKDFTEVASRADDIFRRWHRILPGDEKELN